MYNSHFFFCLLLTSFVITAQKPIDKLPLNSARSYNWAYDSFSYADLGTGEEHSYFSIAYQLNPKLYAELQVFYDTYTLTNRLRTELQIKRYLTKKMYLFSGLQIEAETRNVLRRSIPPPRVGLTGGLGYDVNENFLLEAKGNFQLNKSPLGVLGEGRVPMPRVYTLGGKVRF